MNKTVGSSWSEAWNWPWPYFCFTIHSSTLAPAPNQTADQTLPPTNGSGGRSATNQQPPVPQDVANHVAELSSMSPPTNPLAKETLVQLASSYSAPTTTTVTSIVPTTNSELLAPSSEGASNSVVKSSKCKWGPPRLVEIHRKETENLGISIVGEFTVKRNASQLISGIHISLILNGRYRYIIWPAFQKSVD